MITIYVHRSETISSVSSNFAKKFRKIRNLPIRYIIILLSAFATTVQYTLRTILSVTIVAMVKKTISNSTNDGQSLDSCPVYYQNFNEPTNRLEGPYDWSPTLQGIVLGAFYYGYVITTTYGGQLSFIFGSRRLIGASILTSSILTIFIPLAAYYHVIAVIIFRIVTGMAQGVMSPAQYTLLANWIPEEERSTALASLFVGGNIGSVVTMPFAGYMSSLKYAGWPSVFYILGTCGIFCFMLWVYMIRDNPEDHPMIKGKELLYIQKTRVCKRHPHSVPWLGMLRNRQTWVIAIVKCTWAWGYLTIVSKLPAYLESVLHLPLENNGIINSIMYFSLGVSTLFMGYLSDFISRKKLLSKNLSRKMFECIAQLGSGICLSLIPAAGCSINYIITLLVLCMICSGSMAGGENPVVVDLAPDFSGTLYGFTNAIASVPGFLAPLYVGFILDQSPSVKVWNYVFYTAAIIYALGCTIFLIAGTTEPQTWGKLEEEKLEVQTDSKDVKEKDMPLPSPYLTPYSPQEQSDLMQSDETSCQDR